MCWKQEWAMAINNLNHAIEHIERARTKLGEREQRNRRTLQKLRQSKKHNYPIETEPIEVRIVKNQKGQNQCEEIIEDLVKRQNQLFQMIREYGINHSENPKRVYLLMGRYRGLNEDV